MYLFSSVSCKSKKLEEMAGLKSIGLNGPINLPPSVLLWKGTLSAHGTHVRSSRSEVSFWAIDNAAGSNKGRRPPKNSVSTDISVAPIFHRASVGSLKQITTFNAANQRHWMERRKPRD
jgi:hypothetical protein